jgi:hypothetical protein
MTLQQAKQLVIGDRVSSDYEEIGVGTVTDIFSWGLEVTFQETGHSRLIHEYRFSDEQRLQSLAKVEAAS